jgi:hypothetical protein
MAVSMPPKTGRRTALDFKANGWAPGPTMPLWLEALGTSLMDTTSALWEAYHSKHSHSCNFILLGH